MHIGYNTPDFTCDGGNEDTRRIEINFPSRLTAIGSAANAEEIERSRHARGEGAEDFPVERKKLYPDEGNHGRKAKPLALATLERDRRRCRRRV